MTKLTKKKIRYTFIGLAVTCGMSLVQIFIFTYNGLDELGAPTWKISRGLGQIMWEFGIIGVLSAFSAIGFSLCLFSDWILG